MCGGGGGAVGARSPPPPARLNSDVRWLMDSPPPKKNMLFPRHISREMVVRIVMRDVQTCRCGGDARCLLGWGGGGIETPPLPGSNPPPSSAPMCVLGGGRVPIRIDEGGHLERSAHKCECKSKYKSMPPPPPPQV